MPTITEMIPNIDNWPEWAQEAAERGQLVNECMNRIGTLREENRILRANMPKGVMKRLVTQKALAATEGK